MKSRASLLLVPLLLAAQQPDASMAGPRGTAGNGDAGAYDHVGRAKIGAGTTFTASHAQLPLGSVAEVTALDNGQITLVQVTDWPTSPSDAEIILSVVAARALGLSGTNDAVRVRSIQPSAADLAALRAGNAASPRLPAPDALLRALRRQQPGRAALRVESKAMAAKPASAITRKASAPVPVAKAPPAPPAKPRAIAPTVRTPARPGGPLVQVAALRDEARARDVARSLGGHVEQAAGWWRVRLGPFADRAAAQRARDAAVSRGYGGASIIQAP
ncbi:SPOR domain-containing protein [Sphingomonas sp. RHCKR47]|uniref:SPOR domain-containing protein n=1 Tax=Sphingomonas citricola TaxID=2862498 RepID=UPI001CA4F478|nr:SPOR domain-containing protein [Sphingomonas citricola]MBW6523603.1 SPOR domain-containing protein [Sphingomonas citricola]